MQQSYQHDFSTLRISIFLDKQESFVQHEMRLINQPKGVDYFLIIENVKNKTYVEKVLKKRGFKLEIILCRTERDIM